MTEITGREFANRAKSLIGLTYNQCDCIGVIRKSLGIRIQGTNWLWRSIENSNKYRYLTNRKSVPPEGSRLQDGLVLFRIKWDVVPEGYKDKPDAHHVGVLIYENGLWSVIQSNPKTGVCLSDYHDAQWDGYGTMKNVLYNPFLDPVYHGTINADPPLPAEPHADLNDHEMIKAIYYKLIGAGD